VECGRAVGRVRVKIHTEGKLFAFLFKGLLKSSDLKIKQQLSQLCAAFHSYQKASNSHSSSIRQERDGKMLEHKRTLAKVFKESKLVSK